MSEFTATAKKKGSLALEGEMTIFQAAQIKPALLEHLAAQKQLDINLSGITELDTSGVQLMLMLQREAEQQKKTLRWTHHSPAIARVLELLNLGSAFDAPATVVWS